MYDPNLVAHYSDEIAILERGIKALRLDRRAAFARGDAVEARELSWSIASAEQQREALEDRIAHQAWGGVA